MLLDNFDACRCALRRSLGELDSTLHTNPADLSQVTLQLTIILLDGCAAIEIRHIAMLPLNGGVVHVLTCANKTCLMRGGNSSVRFFNVEYAAAYAMSPLSSSRRRHLISVDMCQYDVQFALFINRDPQRPSV